MTDRYEPTTRGAANGDQDQASQRTNLVLNDVITDIYGFPASSTFAGCQDPGAAVTATGLQRDGGPNSAKVNVSGQTEKGSKGTAPLLAREPVQVEDTEDGSER